MSDASLNFLVEQLAASRAECQRLRSALERQKQGMQNILEFRKLSANFPGSHNGYGSRYGALTREEIEGVLAEIEAALASTTEVAK